MECRAGKETMKEKGTAPLRPIYRRITMQSKTLTDMIAPGAGHLRDVCHALMAGSSHKVFSSLMALNETILLRTAERREEKRQVLVRNLPEYKELMESFKAERQALLDEYAEKNADGSNMTTIGEEEIERISVAEEDRKAYSEKEAALSATFMQQLSALVEGDKKVASLAKFDAAPVMVNLCLFRWKDVPEEVGGGMLLAALPLFDEVPRAVIRAARKAAAADEVAGNTPDFVPWQGMDIATAQKGELPPEPTDPEETAPDVAD